MTTDDRDLILRVEAKVDRIIDRYDVHDRMLTDHEARLRQTERWKNALPVSTLLFMATTVLAVVALFMRAG